MIDLSKRSDKFKDKLTQFVVLFGMDSEVLREMIYVTVDLRDQLISLELIVIL